MRITKGYDVTPRGTSRHTSRENSSASLNTSHYSRENSSLSQNSVEKVYTTRQVATSKIRHKVCIVLETIIPADFIGTKFLDFFILNLSFFSLELR